MTMFDLRIFYSNNYPKPGTRTTSWLKQYERNEVKNSFMTKDREEEQK
jgi:hypothetical protein